MKRACDGQDTDSHGHTKDFLRTHYGLPTGGLRTFYGLPTDMKRASDGRHTDALRSACFRGTPVERAGVCASVVRSAFVRRSVASCVAFVLCWFVWRSCAADSPRACDGLLTGGGRAGIRLMPTFCDIPRWAAARWRTIHGRETDTPRATHGRTTGGARASLRTSDGRATGGLRSDLDKPRCAEMGGGRLRGTRTGNGLAAR